jgi:hypothetical protein|tara:strand:- start:574 stop:726 length:153 start_codon:yes stop_codon:yes gene_type:complete
MHERMFRDHFFNFKKRGENADVSYSKPETKDNSTQTELTAVFIIVQTPGK